MKALFINLDGTTVTTKSGRAYPLHSEDWQLNLDLLPVIKDAYKKKYKVFIITNQPQIKQGFSTDFLFTRRIKNIITLIESRLSLKNLIINYEYNSELDSNHYNNKPNPGMAYELAIEHELSLLNSVMVGDTLNDKLFAQNAGIGYYCDVKDLNTLQLK